MGVLPIQRRAPAPLELASCADELAADVSLPSTEEPSSPEYEATLCIKNTFLEFPSEQKEASGSRRRTRSAPCRGRADVEAPEQEQHRVAEAAPSACQAEVSGAAWQMPPMVIRLADMLGGPEIGGPEMPTVGSAGHRAGRCKPCAFVWKDSGCENGAECPFCHLCDVGEGKRRKKELKAARRGAAQQGSVQGSPTASCTSASSITSACAVAFGGLSLDDRTPQPSPMHQMFIGRLGGC